MHIHRLWNSSPWIRSSPKFVRRMWQRIAISSAPDCRSLRAIRFIFGSSAMLLAGWQLAGTALHAQTYVYNQTGFQTGAKSSGIVPADFNGDHQLDLAVANKADNTVSDIDMDYSVNPRIPQNTERGVLWTLVASGSAALQLVGDP